MNRLCSHHFFVANLEIIRDGTVRSGPEASLVVLHAFVGVQLERLRFLVELVAVYIDRSAMF